jgi:hypothetical protein
MRIEQELLELRRRVDPNDVGPAWINWPDGREEKANGGEWMTRAEARRLAAEKSYEIEEDE